MPTTSPDNIYYPESTTGMALETILAQQASSVQDAFDAFGLTKQLQTYDWANATERAAETGMTEGAIGYQRDTDAYYNYNGVAWVLLLPLDTRVVPSSATNGSVSSTGVVTSTAQTLVRVRDSFPTGFSMFRVHFDVTMSAAVGVLFRLAIDATDASTAYDYQRTSFISTTTATVQDLNQTSASLSPVGLAGARHVGSLVLSGPNVAEATYYDASSVASANPMTTSAGKLVVGGLHRTATAYNSLTLFGSSGNITVNRLTVEGIA